MTPNGRASSVEDWRRLLETLLRQENQLDLQLKQVAEARGSADGLDRRLTQLRALRELCEAELEQARQEHRQAHIPTPAIPRSGSRMPRVLNLQSRHARLHARRADHTILVVDDHPPTLYTATRLLKRSGYGVMQATTGAEAMLLSTRASALLLDVNLPDTNGVAVCQAVKRSSIKPVILMSAVYTDELHQGAGMSAGADLYLTSLLDGEQLARSFDKLLAASPA
jgi:CheY-like chemotaxis protein